MKIEDTDTAINTNSLLPLTLQLNCVTDKFTGI